MSEQIDLTEEIASARRIAGGFARFSSPVDRDDIESDALYGLVCALKAYEPKRGAFMAFAKRCVRNAIKSGQIKRRHWLLQEIERALLAVA